MKVALAAKPVAEKLADMYRRRYFFADLTPMECLSKAVADMDGIIARGRSDRVELVKGGGPSFTLRKRDADGWPAICADTQSLALLVGFCALHPVPGMAADFSASLPIGLRQEATWFADRLLLPEAVVREICRRSIRGEDLAMRYGVSRSHVEIKACMMGVFP